MKKELFGLSLDEIGKNRLLEELTSISKERASSYLCAVNVHMTVLSQKDELLRQAVNEANWAITDGTPISWTFSFFNKVSQKRIAGMDLTPKLLDVANQNGLTISVYGNTEENLKDFRKYIQSNFPKLKIGMLISPPFREISKEEEEKYLDQINNSGTNVLFVSLGCPKQEKWMLKHSSSIHGVCLGIGNAINTVIGKEKRPPPFVQKIGMEWFYRLLQNPKRLFKRYLYTNTVFSVIVLKELCVRNIYKWKLPRGK